VSISNSLAVMAPAGCHILSGCPFPQPSINDFYFRPIFSIGAFHFTKPMLIAVVSGAIVLGFFFVAFPKKPKLVPRGVQNVGEIGVLFVRDQILRPQLGKAGDKYLPFLVSLFFFIWIMNLFGIIPYVEFPATSKYAYPVGLALVVWFTYLAIGIRSQGLLGYLKSVSVPSGAPWWILWLLVPIEFVSNIFVRPFTLSVRLMANMLAGHLLLLVFGLAAWYLFSFSYELVFSATSLLVTVLMAGLEVLIQFLQAFIFTTLAAFYIADAQAAH